MLASEKIPLEKSMVLLFFGILDFVVLEKQTEKSDVDIFVELQRPRG
ncbi:MAG: hypothetical protein QXQ24_08075 [Nitrososphaeria archaeon]